MPRCCFPLSRAAVPLRRGDNGIAESSAAPLTYRRRAPKPPRPHTRHLDRTRRQSAHLFAAVRGASKATAARGTRTQHAARPSNPRRTARRGGVNRLSPSDRRSGDSAPDGEAAPRRQSDDPTSNDRENRRGISERGVLVALCCPRGERARREVKKIEIIHRGDDLFPSTMKETEARRTLAGFPCKQSKTRPRCELACDRGARIRLRRQRRARRHFLPS